MISYADFLSLHQKISQYFEAHSLRNMNLNISVFLNGDQRKRHSSFEEFGKTIGQEANAVEVIAFEYNILLKEHNNSQNQKYTIELVLCSHVAIQKNAHISLDNVRLRSRIPSGQLTVEFSNYAIGNVLKHTVDDWYRLLEKKEDSFILKHLEKYYRIIPNVLKAISITVYLCISAFFIEPLLAQNENSNSFLYLVSLVTFGGAYIVGALSFHVGTSLISSIFRIRSIATLNLTQGDNSANREFYDKKKRNIGRVLLYLTGLITLNIIANIASNSVVEGF